MSRVGRMPIQLPEGVSVELSDGWVEVKGPKGNLKQELLAGFEIKQNESVLNLIKTNDSKQGEPYFGLMRTLIANMVKGVAEGFEKRLVINGVGYRAQLKANELVLSLGYSHPINFTPPEGIELKTEGNNIVVSGIDKQLVGEVAAQIRAFRKPEPYKGKGIRYDGEYIRRKAGKAAAKTGAGV